MQISKEPEYFSHKARLFRLEGALQGFTALVALLWFILVAVMVFRPALINVPREVKLYGLLFLAITNAMLHLMIRHLRFRWMEMERLAGLDRVTGVFNRNSFERLLDEELRRGGRYHYPISICYMDLDNFKSFNEHFGSTKGDELLRKFGQMLQGTVRFADCVSRFQNDEFCVLLPHTDIVRAEKFIARIMAMTQEKVDFTFCAGVTAYQPGENKAQTIMRAIGALEQAKREGKRKVRYIVGDTTTTVSF